MPEGFGCRLFVRTMEFLFNFNFNCHTVIAVSILIWQWLVNGQLSNYNIH